MTRPTGEIRDAYNFFLRNTEGKRSLGKTRQKTEDDIKMDLKEMKCEFGLDSRGSE
jgi:hypothetical protein